MTNKNKKTAILGVLIIAFAFVLVAFTTVSAEGNALENNYQISTATPTPAPAVEVFLQIQNYSGRKTKVVLDGDFDYEIQAAKGSAYYKIAQGEYTYTFTVPDCSYTETGEMNVIFDGHVLRIEKCPPPPRLAQSFVVLSYYDFDIEVSFDPQFNFYAESAEYVFPVAPGRNTFHYKNLVEGDYIWSFEACGETKSGLIKLKFDYPNELQFKGCEYDIQQADYEEYGKTVSDMTKLRVNNRTTDSIYVTLIGEKTYGFLVGYGVHIQELYAGTYHYVYALHGERYEGDIYVSGNGDTVLMAPGSVQ